MDAVDRIKIIAESEYDTAADRRDAIQVARAAEVAEAFKSVSFPCDVSIGDSVVQISDPICRGNALRFSAAVRVDGKVVHRDEHVIVNPPLLYPDESGKIERLVSVKGEQRVERYRIDPLACAAQAVIDSI